MAQYLPVPQDAFSQWGNGSALAPCIIPTLLRSPVEPAFDLISQALLLVETVQALKPLMPVVYL